ncbi:putative C6 transcription factor [Cladophialophora carrionii]|uniref:Putative C6 transcription factor n=1 Tax=Cladophialophora carrionii TaxID=86049 RepID=A0A1C1CGY9_9EURO|nr:putative C6 transcription factor [Cladophialophora carrionii]
MVFSPATTANGIVSMIGAHTGRGTREQTLPGKAVEARNRVLAKLLPSLDFDSLPDLRREDIIQLISSEQDSNDGVPVQDHELDRDSRSADGNTAEDAEHEWDEAARQQDYTSPIADDVNGLALSHANSSYLGTSSISIALRSIFALCPTAKQAFLRLSNTLSSSAARGKEPLAAALSQSPRDIAPLPSSFSDPQPEQLAIDAYFDHVHLMLPMVDETWFRTEFTTRGRTDDAWVALSGMILALGSIAAGDDRLHTSYYARVQQVTGHNVFASGHLEMLQALILLGGSYLHYINSPNTAYLILGTAFRMATAMALHRDPAAVPSNFSHHSAGLHPTLPVGYSLPRAELRRRTWWCLICSDAWNGILLGRPSMTRWDPLTMDTCMPSDTEPGEQANIGHPYPIKEGDFSGTSLRLSSQFCKISSKIEYRLSQLSRLSAREVLAFESQLLAWEKSRPTMFKAGTACPERVRNVRDSVYHRCQIARIVMSRPHLLRLTEEVATCRSFTDEDWHVVSICRDAASELINSITANRLRTRISVWHTSWYLFQACMIPLLSIGLNDRLPAEAQLEEVAICGYREELERAVRTFKNMAPWTRSTDKYGEVVEALYSGVALAPRNQDAASTIQSSSGGFGGFTAVNLGGPFALDEQTLDMFDTFPDWFDYGLVFGAQLGEQ